MKNRYELIVVGGGFAGAAAAISAAKSGVDVLLIERYNCLGGAAAHGLVLPFMRYWTKLPGETEQTLLSGSVFLEIVTEMNQITGDRDNLRMLDEEVIKLVLNRMAQKYGAALLFNTTVTGAAVVDGTVASVTAMSRGVTMELFADHFIDATGDAELSTLAGCTSRVGRESDGLCQPMTLSFRMCGIETEKFFRNKAEINALYNAFQAKGLIRNPHEDIIGFKTYNDGVMHFNATRVVKRNPTDPFDVTQAELEAREQVYELHRFLQENVDGFQNARVLSTAMQIGIRESRKVEGEYTLTGADLKSFARFDDAIAVANYSIDIHSPDGAGTTLYRFGDGEWYEIPYRCLLPRRMNNLLVAGRCLSASHEAQASCRVMPYCAAMGQAAGTAVAVAKRTGTTVRTVDVAQVQEILRREGYRI